MCEGMITSPGNLRGETAAMQVLFANTGEKAPASNCHGLAGV